MGNPQESSAPSPENSGFEQTDQTNLPPPVYQQVQPAQQAHPLLQQPVYSANGQTVLQVVQGNQLQGYSNHAQTSFQTGSNNVTTQPIYVQIPSIHGRDPLLQVCQFCQKNIVTNVSHEMGTGGWLICLGMCLIGCTFCCCLPCCITDLQDAVHQCPSCNQVVGVKKLM